MEIFSILLVFGVLGCYTTACEIDLPCTKCVERKCVFVLSKSSKTYCVVDRKNVEAVRMVMASKAACDITAAIIESFRITHGNSLDEILKPAATTTTKKPLQPTRKSYTIFPTRVLPAVRTTIPTKSTTPTDLTPIPVENITTKIPLKNITRALVQHTPTATTTKRPVTTSTFVPHPFYPIRNESFYRLPVYIPSVNTQYQPTLPSTTKHPPLYIRPFHRRNTTAIHSGVTESQPSDKSYPQTQPTSLPFQMNETVHVQTGALLQNTAIFTSTKVPKHHRNTETHPNTAWRSNIIIITTTTTTTTEKPSFHAYLPKGSQSVHRVATNATRTQPVLLLPSTSTEIPHQLETAKHKQTHVSSNSVRPQIPLCVNPYHNITNPFRKPKTVNTVAVYTAPTEKQSSQQEIADVKELFQLMPYKISCKHERNVTLIISYVLTLCAVDRLVNATGYDKFDEHTASYFKLNRARRYRGFCYQLHRDKKRCRVPGLRRIRDVGPTVSSGTFSLFLAQIDGSPFCFDNVTKEQKNDKLARLLCYSSYVFDELKKEVVLNHYDLAYGNMSPIYAYRKKCRGISMRKATCYNKI